MKRRVGDVDDETLTLGSGAGSSRALSEGIKKWQHQRIFSDAHIYTVDMLMTLMKEAQKHEHTQTGDSTPIVEEQEPEGTKQKPYWPVITRLKRPEQ